MFATHSTILSQGIARPPPVNGALLDRAIVELTQDDIPPAHRHKLAGSWRRRLAAEAQAREATRRELGVGR